MAREELAGSDNVARQGLSAPQPESPMAQEHTHNLVEPDSSSDYTYMSSDEDNVATQGLSAAQQASASQQAGEEAIEVAKTW